MNLHLSSNTKKILIFHNGLAPKIDQIASFVKKEWPKAKILFITQKPAKIKDTRKPGVHLYSRKSTLSISEVFKLGLRLKQMRPHIILIRKHDLSLKFLLLILVCRPTKLYSWRARTSTKLTFSEINWRSFLIKPFNKKGFWMSLSCSLFPLFLLIALIPTLWLKRCSSIEKKQFWHLLKSNLQQGPLGDNPWLWACLQFIMLLVFLLGKKPKLKYPSRILVIRNDHIGDTINTTPLVKYLKKNYKKAHIVVLCDSGQFLWKDCPYIDEVLMYKTNNRLFNRDGRKFWYVFRPFTYLRTLRKNHFDLVLDPVGRTETHILSYLCGNARRFSNTYYPYELFDVTICCRHYESELHETQRVLSLVKPVHEITKRERDLDIWIKPQIKDWMQNYLELIGIKEQDNLLGIHPSAVSPLRLWPIERFASVACELAAKHNMKIMFFEPPDNPDMAEKFTSILSTLSYKATIVRGTDLLSLTALISRCNLFLCNDSGPMHLAAATKTPTVAIFGPGEYIRWQPQHPNSKIVRKSFICSPCSQNDCINPMCVLQVDIEDVIKAAGELLRIPLNCTQALDSA
jgi:ADP-heptose:LPS heptosyltransferase